MGVDVGDSHLDEGLVGETNENERLELSGPSDTQVEKNVNDAACESDLSSDSTHRNRG
ncbi:hypothetical protein FA13DRAFT_1731064 [Coprinellus micaceus]|uniref:Uncharacterized protein n=1 Tax=Coprinellus micaceus TaxID=71717 RepID=A0A4Y7TGK5_COPMI|nr:hypothetical protein FA13DRAFT_1731064 [Coprinellus micaceus]